MDMGTVYPAPGEGGMTSSGDGGGRGKASRVRELRKYPDGEKSNNLK